MRRVVPEWLRMMDAEWKHDFPWSHSINKISENYDKPEPKSLKLGSLFHFQTRELQRCHNLWSHLVFWIVEMGPKSWETIDWATFIMKRLLLMLLNWGAFRNFQTTRLETLNMCECFISHLHLGKHLAQQPWRDVAHAQCPSVQLKWQDCDCIHTFASLAAKPERRRFGSYPVQRRFWWNSGFPKILQSHQRSRHLLLVMHIASTAQQSSVKSVLLQLPRSLIINRLIS